MKFLTPIILIATAIGLFFLFINPHYKKIGEYRSEAVRHDEAIARAQKLGEKRNSLLVKRDSLAAEDLKRLDKLLPNSVDMIRFIVNVNSVANRYSKTISSIKVSENNESARPITLATASGPTLKTSLLGFSIKMEYEQFKQFLSDIERSLNVIDVQSIQFKPLDTTTEYDFGVTIQTYSLSK